MHQHHEANTSGAIRRRYPSPPAVALRIATATTTSQKLVPGISTGASICDLVIAEEKESNPREGNAQ
jgi:hypothetical protein